MENKELDYHKGEILLIDKPKKWTSFSVVKKIRYLITQKTKKKLKVGHGGTLDPLASGLIIIATGKKTKELEKFQTDTKEYIATIKLGATTPSFDLETEINQTFSTDHITIDLIKETLTNFLGKQLQTPPIFSAKRINGKRAYVSARQGKEIKLEPKEIELFDIEMLDFNDNTLKIKVHCSKGTYIRSLANDIGKSLNSGAYLADLVRTKSGIFSIENAISIDEFQKKLDNTQ